MVMAPARTGRERSRRIVVIVAAQTKRGVFSGWIPSPRMLRAVVMKLMEPRIEEIPAR